MTTPSEALEPDVPATTQPKSVESGEAVSGASGAESIQALFSEEAIEDPVNRGLLNQAAVFMRTPELQSTDEFVRKLSDIVMVQLDYEMVDATVPEQIVTLHLQMLHAMCNYHINVAIAEKTKGDAADETVITDALARARDGGETLAKGYQDGSMRAFMNQRYPKAE